MGEGISRKYAAIVFAGLPLWAQAVAETPADCAHALSFRTPIVAIGEDYIREDQNRERLTADFAHLKELGITHLRFGLSWAETEYEPGKYDLRFLDLLAELAPRYQITLLPYITYTPKWASSEVAEFWRRPPKDPESFGRFVAYIAKKFKDTISSWELWNEPDNQDYWSGSVDEFAKMIRFASLQSREANPHARLILGGFAREKGNFADELLSHYDWRGYFDALNIHGYLETWDASLSEFYPERIKNFRELLSSANPESNLWLGEFGYSSSRLSAMKASDWVQPVFNYEHTPNYQATVLWKQHILARSTDQIDLGVWYRLRDLPKHYRLIGDENNRNLGLLNSDGNPKPSYYALRFFRKVFDLPVIPRSVQIFSSSPDLVASAFERTDGSWIITGWLRSVGPWEVEHNSGMKEDTRVAEVTIAWPSDKLKKRRSYTVEGNLISEDERMAGESSFHFKIEKGGENAFVFLLSPVGTRP